MCLLFGHNPQIIFCHLFHKMNVVIFVAKMNRYLACVCISSYSFMLIPLILYMCLGHGLKMCIFSGYNPQIILLFSQNELSHLYGLSE